jgi:S1-C subfamily serine protease
MLRLVTPSRLTAALLLGALPLAGGLAACGGSDSAGAQKVKTVERTRVRVVEQQRGSSGTRFDAEGLYRRYSPGVVTVVSIFDGGPSILGKGGGEGGQGSGFVIDGDGHIATNAHVVTNGEGPSAKRAKSVYIQFSDGNRVPGKVLGADLNSDVALLKVDPAGLSLTPLSLGVSHGLRVGDPVAAIGSAFGEEQSLSVGVISALDRDIDSLTGFSIGNAIQTDAAINPGNSGGPLLDAGGRVLGINSQIKSSGGGGEGVGFSVPVDTVRRSLRGLRRSGSVSYGYLGVSALSLYPQLASRLKLPVKMGALVQKVVGGAPADKAGLHAGGDTIEFQGDRGIKSSSDVIVSVDGAKVTLRDNLSDLISRHAEGDKVKLEVIHDGQRKTIEITLGKRPASAPKT